MEIWIRHIKRTWISQQSFSAFPNFLLPILCIAVNWSAVKHMVASFRKRLVSFVFGLKLMLSSPLENDTGYPFQTMSILYLCCTLLYPAHTHLPFHVGRHYLGIWRRLCYNRTTAFLTSSQEACSLNMFSWGLYQITFMHSQLTVVFMNETKIFIINISNISNYKYL